MLDELIAEAEIGERAQDFIDSDLGKVLIGMAEQEVLAAQQELETADPAKVTEIIRLQERIKLARQFPEWLQELVLRGEQAKLSWAQQKVEES